MSEPMTVTRKVERRSSGSTSTVVPALDESWDDFKKLQWKAAVATYDTGLNIRVSEAIFLINHIPQAGFYNIHVRGGNAGAYPYREAWVYINGVMAGAGRELHP